MNDRYTFRDFLVYFLSGVVGSVFVAIIYKDEVILMISQNKDLIKDANTLIFLLLVPLFYFLGHIVHGLDIALFYIGRLVRKWYLRYHWLRPLNILINEHRVSDVLFKKNIDYTEFWKNCAKLQAKNLFGPAEYWYVLNDFFKGIYVFSWASIILSLYLNNIYVTCIYIILNILYWLKARMYAQQFVNTVNNTVSILSTLDPKGNNSH